MNITESGYDGLVLEKLTSAGVSIGDTIKIFCDGHEHSGILIPRAQIGNDTDHIVIKLVNGYNIGIRLTTNATIQKSRTSRKHKRSIPITQSSNQSNLPTVSILSTGGTIASKVDYKTGAVNPALSAQDLYDVVPELKDYANIKARIIMSVLSENIQPSDWTKIARSIASEIRNDVDGVVVAHGTDTLGITSAALSFALQNLPVPVVLVGSQRSSDRPSSDAAMNLINSTDFACHVNAAEVMLLMHGETDDSFTYAHRGTRARKCHTSRRDAFQSINCQPLFKINQSKISEISEPLLRRDSARKLQLKPNFDDKVALLKSFPNIQNEIIEYFIDHEFRGIVFEGTGLGHIPERLHSIVKHAINEGIIVAMTSQCVWGRINMNVYRCGVKLLDMGVIPCENMLAETAVVKMMWLLANKKKIETVRELMPISLVGEIDLRTEPSEYCYNKEVL